MRQPPNKLLSREEMWQLAGVSSLDFLLSIEDELDNSSMKTILAGWCQWLVEGFEVNPTSAIEHMLELYYDTMVAGDTEQAVRLSRFAELCKELQDEMNEDT
jgi:hypothetical protein